ncbi:MAG: hypothetical protein GX097_00775 [Methanomicrobiales archaeon]|nr:hypothetical protein [Methanomicrobiales archaeon]
MSKWVYCIKEVPNICLWGESGSLDTGSFFPTDSSDTKGKEYESLGMN